uniref:uncharacterized protein LOC100387335 isoform X3 n=1 Tax=Callithrix jacchus TaxID=9483 RepID=UPI0023DD2730|nr:uncharacterized protein LOC100387335 isoform X3 [Callithrix jacchus]
MTNCPCLRAKVPEEGLLAYADGHLHSWTLPYLLQQRTQSCSQGLKNVPLTPYHFSETPEATFLCGGSSSSEECFTPRQASQAIVPHGASAKCYRCPAGSRLKSHSWTPVASFTCDEASSLDL